MMSPQEYPFHNVHNSNAVLESQRSWDTPALLPVDETKSRWRKTIGQLHAMLTLTDDWDGDDSPAPAPEIVRSAIDFAQMLRDEDYPPPTRVIATPSGTVGFEWQQPSVYTEAEMVTPYRSEWMQVKDGARPDHWVFNRPPFLDPAPELTSLPTTTVRLNSLILSPENLDAIRVSYIGSRAGFNIDEGSIRAKTSAISL
jgi:hypothetical protein